MGEERQGSEAEERRAGGRSGQKEARGKRQERKHGKHGKHGEKYLGENGKGKDNGKLKERAGEKERENKGWYIKGIDQ
jgi:hypothetical protein